MQFEFASAVVFFDVRSSAVRSTSWSTYDAAFSAVELLLVRTVLVRNLHLESILSKYLLIVYNCSILNGHNDSVVIAILCSIDAFSSSRSGLHGDECSLSGSEYSISLVSAQVILCRVVILLCVLLGNFSVR